MKNTNRSILISILILLISAVAITYFYISNHLLSQVSDIETGSVLAIYFQIGLVGALIPALAFLIFSFLKKTARNSSLRHLFNIILAVMVFLSIYLFVMYMTFYKFNPPIQFSQPIGLN